MPLEKEEKVVINGVTFVGGPSKSSSIGHTYFVCDHGFLSILEIIDEKESLKTECDLCYLDTGDSYAT